ncbi:amino acid permease-associated region [Liquorilactobacillus oeni DSM 19972]|uniref:Amino acid permease-associated region n=2 Tax=Liquorilactobacillus oeni TaxID=303241 RepID=A0A0R1MAS2_9LACO|nr:amino acid permease-associated region [Liquorilactobacillus oeni DSM 19972]
MKSKKLSLLEVLGLSVAMLAPTGAMAFNTAGAVTNSGIVAPLGFLLAGLGILFVGISFVELGRKIPGEGSAYAYNAKALGEKTGFISGWLLVLTYTTFAFSSSAVVGNFLDVFFRHFNIIIPVPLYVIFVLLLGGTLSHKGIEFSTRFALVLELFAVGALVILTLIIWLKGGDAGLSTKPLNPANGTLSGIGAGMIFALMSFAGFEGSATIAPRAKNPAKAITTAILGAVIFAMVFYFTVTYTEIIGFGTANIGKMQNSTAPLNYLAIRYVGSYMAIFIDFASVTSYFACYFGALNAGAFMLEALSKNGYLMPWLGDLRGEKRTPVHALDLITVLALIFYAIVGIGFKVSAGNYYNYFGTIGVIALLLVYVLVNTGAIAYFRKQKQGRFKHLLAPIIGILVMIFPIYSNLWPIPAWPMNTFPYIVFIWLILGFFVPQKKAKVKENTK